MYLITCVQCCIACFDCCQEETVDLLIEAMQAQPEAHFYLIEGFPRNLQQLEDFNAKVSDSQILLNNKFFWDSHD